MKKLCLLLAIVMLLSVGCQPTTAPEQPTAAPAEVPAPTEAPAEAGMQAGTYTATCHGFYGDFDVSVTVSDAAITGIEYGEYKETEAVGGKALALLSEEMVAQNTAGVDAVSGATVTSAVFRAAVTDCLAQAGAPEALTASPAQPEKTDAAVDTDVLVIGAGAAGFAAAVSAAENGAKVTLIEKQDIVGGSTVLSAGIVYAAVDENDVSTMVDYYMERADQKADRELLQFFAEHSIDTIKFLEGIGITWMMTVPAGTAPQPRAHFSQHADGTAMIGSALINPLQEKAISLGVEILTGTKATELIVNNGAIAGAKAESDSVNYTFNAKAVVLATGGFDASEELKGQYSPIAVGDFPLSSKGSKGEGILMGIDAGAATVFNGGMIGFEIVDGSLPNSGNNAAAMGSNAFVQADGTFIALGSDYPINYTALKNAGGASFFGLYDAAGKDTAESAVEKNFGFKADTVEELAAAAGMDAAKLQDAFGKTEALTTAPFYAVVVKPATIGSMGGLKINTRAEVLSAADGSPIAGLYAAGEVANGGFYYQEYPASGSSISLALTYGREAGKNAAELAKAE